MARPKASWFDGSRKARGTENLIDILAIRGIHVIGDAERLGEASAVCAHHRSSSFLPPFSTQTSKHEPLQ